MSYKIEFKHSAVKDLRRISNPFQAKIIDKIESLSNGLTGDIKKLTNSSNDYRLRVGNYRVLFSIENDIIIIYRIRHRKEVYK